jgi:hypothetical protein
MLLCGKIERKVSRDWSALKLDLQLPKESISNPSKHKIMVAEEPPPIRIRVKHMKLLDNVPKPSSLFIYVQNPSHLILFPPRYLKIITSSTPKSDPIRCT